MIKLDNNGLQLRNLDTALYRLNRPAWKAISDGKHLWGGVEPIFEPHLEKLLEAHVDGLAPALCDFLERGRRVSY
jgi:hypothetical protein